MLVKVINKSNNDLPEYQTKSSAGLDLRANLQSPILLEPNERILVPTGLFMDIEQGYEGQIRPRSGLALKSGITVINSPGTIDSDYRGEIGVILINHSKGNFLIKNGDRIAQIVFSKVEQAEFESVLILTETERGDGGFGHTGKK